jgi:hypothetical protein
MHRHYAIQEIKIYYQETFSLDQAFSHTLREFEAFQVEFELAEEILLFEIN